MVAGRTDRQFWKKLNHDYKIIRKGSDLNGSLNVALFQTGALGRILTADINCTRMHCLKQVRFNLFSKQT